MASLLVQKCKCRDGNCFTQFDRKQVQGFLDEFEKRQKREQDTILFLAFQDGLGERREYSFLDKPMRRACFEALLGVSSHRIDKVGAIDLRYKGACRPRGPTELAASIDSFCMVLYNSVAEPLPNKLVRIGPARGKTSRRFDHEDSDHWGEGGVTYNSEFEDNDEDLAKFLQTNTSFLINMVKTSGFSATRRPTFYGFYLSVLKPTSNPLRNCRL